MSNQRVIRIIDELIQSDSSLTIKKLAEILQCSQSTIRNDLIIAEDYVKEWNLEIIKERGVGVRLEGTSFDINLYMDSKIGESTYSEIDERLQTLTVMLIENKERFTTIDELSERLFVSRSTTQNDLVTLTEEFKKNRILLETKQKKGVRILGDEFTIRKMYSEALGKLRNDVAYSKSIKSQIFDYLHINPNYIFSIVRRNQKEFKLMFTDDSFHGLVIHIAIAIKRIMDGKLVQHSESFDKSKFQLEYKIAEKTASEIASSYNIAFNESEIYFLFLHLISTKVMKEQIEVSHLTGFDENTHVYTIASEIIELVKNTKQISINDDKYFNNLLIHLRPTLNRLEYGFKLDNPLLESIKKEYPEAYGIAWMSNSIFRRYTGKELSEDEAAFIAIHIQSILEENHDSIKLVIVCSSGIGISQLLATRVEKIFPNVVIVAVESVYSFSQRTHKDIDLVLSTFPVETSLPVLRVSPLLNDKDVQLIENFIKHYRTSYDSLFNYVQIETFLQKDWNSQEQIIHEVATTLEYKGLVTPEFKEEIHKREMINSTAIGMLVALPHATFGTVIATHLSIVTLTKPVLWGEDMVDLVVFIAITERDASWVPLRLRNIYYKFYSEETHNRLLQKTSKTEIINILTE